MGEVSMDKFESSIKVIPYPQEKVYALVSDLNNLERVKDRIPEDKVQSLTYDSDNVTVTVAPVGKVTLSIVEREPCKTVKFGSPDSPIAFNLWIQIVPIDAQTSKMRVTVKINLNILTRNLMKGKIEEAVEKLAEMLSQVNYD